MRSRTQYAPLNDWWRTIDRMLLGALAVLMLSGLVFSLAASPPVAMRMGHDPFHFVNRQVLFLVPAVLILLVTSMLSPRQLRRLAAVVFVTSLCLVAATVLYGAEVKGARRWISVFGLSLQPSEFLKPAFVIVVSWLFAESTRRPEMPANSLALVLLLLVVALIVLQPDFGQTLLILAVWGTLFFMAGVRLVWVVGLAGSAIAGLAAAYFTVPYVSRRINAFIDPASADTFNVGIALESFMRGGWVGQGPGEGTVKRILPESHTDFVFAVVAEEFGIAACLILVALFAFIVVRALHHALSNEDAFVRFAVAGLAVLFGAQAAINMAVNLHLLPAKGMTLPFISYGGSSMISLAYAMGMLLALTRERPRAELLASRSAFAGGAV
jgi:cell division protein FtsW